MTQSTAITPIGQICKAIDQMGSSLGDNLKGTGISPDRFLVTAKMAVQTHGDKDKLARADRKSLYLAIQKAAGDGLMPDGREAALVVYGSQVQYQPMVQGLVKLARQSGEIESLGAYVVHENDDFSYQAGTDSIPQHKADWFGERGEAIGVWAFIKLKSGDYLDPVMLTKERVLRIASRSKMQRNYDVKNGKDWEEFWKKAAIRNILKYAPKSTYLDNAMNADNNEFKMEDTAETEVVSEAAPKAKRKTRAAAAVKAKSEEAEVVTEEVSVDEPEIIDAEAEVIEGEIIEHDDDDLPV